MSTPLVPDNLNGKQCDITETKSLPDSGAAHQRFALARERLLRPATWHEAGGLLSASFTLLDDEANEVDNRPVKVGDYLRIDVPGPGTLAGGGYDWVAVEAVEDKPGPHSDHELAGIRVRSCSKPASNNKDTAHFFKASATSTFIIERRHNILTAHYHGRNELPNTDTGIAIDNMRNALVAITGMAGLSEIQWKAFINGLLAD